MMIEVGKNLADILGYFFVEEGCWVNIRGCVC